MAKPINQCMSRKCESERHCRGVCIACYFECRRKIKAGEITDAELVRRRLWLKPNRSGRPSKNMMAKQIAAIAKPKRKLVTSGK